jgi:hypothetical protein
MHHRSRCKGKIMSIANSAATTSGSWRWRAILPAIDLGLLGAAVALYVWAPSLYMSILSALMLRPSHRYPFFDFEYLLTNATCWQRGVNVYISNPCDPANRPMGYSPLWPRMSFLAINPGWTVFFGLGLAVLFCLSLAVLVPSRRWRDLVVIGLASVSSLSLYALERGNVDLIIYFFALAAGIALAGSAVVRLVGYGLLLGAGLLKFYPVAALVVVVRERLIACIGIALASIAIIVGFVLSYYDELIAALRNIPSGSYFWDSIGARQLPGGIGYVLQPILTRIGAAGWSPAANSRILIYAVAFLLMVSLCTLVAWMAISAEHRHHIAALPPRYGALLQIGAALMVGCFFAGQSVGYRAILLLLVLPGLALLDRPEIPSRLRRLSRYTTVLILVVMFRLAIIDIFYRHDLSPLNSASAGLTWIGFELAWWWIIGVLLALLTCFFFESRAWQDARIFLCRAGLVPPQGEPREEGLKPAAKPTMKAS